MIIKIMPILHARTFNIDFRTGKLLVEPEVFTESDSAQIYDIAKESTRQFEMAPKCGRYVIYGVGSYVVIGRTVKFIDLYTSCNKMPQYCNVDKEDGRSAYGFVGVMIPAGTIVDPIVISDSLILDIYERCIADRWNEHVDDIDAFSTKKMGLIDVDVPLMLQQPDYESLLNQISCPIVLEDSDDLREQIIYNVMRKALKGEIVSLCTSVTAIDNNTPFSVITCKNASFKAKEVAKALEQLKQNPETNRTTSNKLSPFPKRNCSGDTLKKSTSTSHIAASKRSEQSFDDILKETITPETDEESSQSRLLKKNQDIVWEKSLSLGTILGITFFVVELVNYSSPLLMAITGTCTVIIGGMEAKRIIDKFKS